MAKKDFDKYVNGLRVTLQEDAINLTKVKEAYEKGETDEKMLKSYEKAYRDDRYRFEVLLFAKALLDQPTRKSKKRVWAKQSKLPKTMPTKD